MKTLCIDTAHTVGFVALFDGCEVVTFTTFERGGLAEAASEINLTELDLIALGNGPGSFTGLRTGMSFGLGLQVALKVPIVEFSSLMAYPAGEKGPFVTLFDARAGGVYLLEGDRQEGVIWKGDPLQLSIEELNSQFPEIALVSVDHEALSDRIGREVKPAPLDIKCVATQLPSLYESGLSLYGKVSPRYMKAKLDL